MFTRCPHCETCYRITTEQLKAARGEARCGRCFGTFNSLEYLVEEPEEVVVEAPSTQRPESALHSEDPFDLINELHADDKASPSSHFMLWLLSALLLCTTLAGQYAYFNLQHLSQEPQLRPALKLLCSFSHCDVPLLHAPEHIKLMNRDIRIHPSLKNMLQVKAEMVNSADFTQSYPLLELSLQDITGHALAQRRFKAEEYLSNSETNIKQGLAPRQSVHILLELVDPGEDAVGFEFDFL